MRTDGRRCDKETYSELEGLDETNGFFNGTADGQIVDGDLAGKKKKIDKLSSVFRDKIDKAIPQDTLRVDDEETTEGNTSFLNQDTIVPTDRIKVSKWRRERDLVRP